MLMIHTLQDQYVSLVQRMYDAAQQTLAAIPILARAVNHADLRLALEAQRRQTGEHVRRLEQLFGRHGLRPEPRESPSIRTLIAETQDVLREVEDARAVEGLVTGVARLIEQHFIIGNGVARMWALRLGLTEDAEVLGRAVREEETTAEMLADIAGRMASRIQLRAEREVTPLPRALETPTPPHGVAPMQGPGAVERDRSGTQSA